MTGSDAGPDRFDSGVVTNGDASGAGGSLDSGVGNDAKVDTGTPTDAKVDTGTATDSGTKVDSGNQGRFRIQGRRGQGRRHHLEGQQRLQLLDGVQRREHRRGRLGVRPGRRADDRAPPPPLNPFRSPLPSAGEGEKGGAAEEDSRRFAKTMGRRGILAAAQIFSRR